MRKNSLIEYPTYLLIRLLGMLVVSLPLRVNFILGKSIGSALYYLLKKKRRLVLKNLKMAFSDYSYEELEKIAKGAFVSLALNIIETLYIPRIDSRYINKHIRIENLNYLEDGLKMKKGVILLAFHLGNWELANITCGLQGYNYKVVVNEQRYPLLNKLLNKYRESKGCQTISRGVALRQILCALKNNEVVAMVGDQGGRDGRLSNFFGIPTSMPVGFIRFALNTEALIIPAIIIRERKFYHRIILESPLKIEAGDGNDKVIQDCLSQSSRILENYIEKYPQEYFWFYKIWKYSPFKSVVVLSDGRAGHLRQAQAVSKVISGFEFQVSSKDMEIKFKNKFTRLLAGVFIPQEFNAWRFFLTKESYLALRNVYADFVVSCGSKLAGLNLALARENLAKSICIMKPAVLSYNKFDLVVIPKHDNPPLKKNVCVTIGALNLIDEEYLKEESSRLKLRMPNVDFGKSIGLFIGGDSKKYKLTESAIEKVSFDLKKASQDLGLDILITTSRRTSKGVENLVKKECGDFARCKLLVVASRNNIPEAVGGILGLSDFVVVSGESISMVSEAASSGKYVIVFKSKNSKKHNQFLNYLAERKYIYLSEPDGIYLTLSKLSKEHPAINILDNRTALKEALKKIV